MPTGTTSKVTFPICQDVTCMKNVISDKMFWKRELDHQYQFYLATLRAERDTRYLIQDNSTLLSQIRTAETDNVELRKKIRMLEIELFLMYQRNAHDSCVIDGLHEADYEVEETELLESQARRRLNFAAAEGDHEECLIGILTNEIALLRRKDGEDAKLSVSVNPLEEQLKLILEEEKITNHQQAMKFKRELEELFNEFQEKNIQQELIKSEKSSEILWTEEIFTSVYGIKMIQQPSDSDASSVDSSQETERFDVSAEDDIPTDIGKEFQTMKRECCEYIAKKELLDSKNVVSLHLIHDNLQKLTKCMENWADEYVFLYEVIADIAFINEYLIRLDEVRKKKDVTNTDENTARIAHRLDQMNLIFSSLLSENALIRSTLRYFTSTLREDFEAHCAMFQKTEELFATAAVE